MNNLWISGLFVMIQQEVSGVTEVTLTTPETVTALRVFVVVLGGANFPRSTRLAASVLFPGTKLTNSPEIIWCNH